MSSASRGGLRIVRYDENYHIVNAPRTPRKPTRPRDSQQAGWIELYLEARALVGLGEPRGIHPWKCPPHLRTQPAERETQGEGPLTEASRERIAVMVGNGMSYRAVANALSVSLKTVQRVMANARTA